MNLQVEIICWAYLPNRTTFIFFVESVRRVGKTECVRQFIQNLNRRLGIPAQQYQLLIFGEIQWFVLDVHFFLFFAIKRSRLGILAQPTTFWGTLQLGEG